MRRRRTTTKLFLSYGLSNMNFSVLIETRQQLLLLRDVGRGHWEGQSNPEGKTKN